MLRKDLETLRAEAIIQAINEKQVDHILEYFKAEKIVVGHTSDSAIKSLYSRKVIAIDASLKKGLNGELLLIEDNQFFRGLLNGKRIELN